MDGLTVLTVLYIYNSSLLLYNRYICIITSMKNVLKSIRPFNMAGVINVASSIAHADGLLQ